jgi:hypothetical protein
MVSESDLRQRIESAVRKIKSDSGRASVRAACVDELVNAVRRYHTPKPDSWRLPTPKQAAQELRRFAAAVESGQSFDAAADDLTAYARDLIEEWRWQHSLPVPWQPTLRAIPDAARAARLIAARIAPAGHKTPERRGRHGDQEIDRLGRTLRVVYFTLTDRWPGRTHGYGFAAFVGAVLEAGGINVPVSRIVDSVTGFNANRKVRRLARNS